jgi:hypothetical protein
MKRKGKLVKLTPRPLILKDAKDYLAYRLDQGLARSAWFEPIGKTDNVVRLPQAMKGYFTKNQNKLRPYKIRLGAKRAIRNGYIEKKKFVGDTASEIKALRLARAKARKRTPTKRLIKRKIVKKRQVKRTTTKSKKKQIKKVIRRKSSTRKSSKKKVKKR